MPKESKVWSLGIERVNMNSMQYSDMKIAQGLKQLEDKLTQLSIFAVIIRPYFFDYVIVDAHPLVWLIVETIHHVYGQTTRCWFDRANKKHKTVSVCEIYEQIKRSEKYKKKSPDKLKAFNKNEKIIKKMKNKYKKRMSDFTNKYYAHNEIRTKKQRQREFEMLKAGWQDIEDLILSAKNITNDMFLFWKRKEANFRNGDYPYFREFWNSINPEVLKPVSHFFKK